MPKNREISRVLLQVDLLLWVFVVVFLHNDDFSRHERDLFYNASNFVFILFEKPHSFFFIRTFSGFTYLS